MPYIAPVHPGGTLNSGARWQSCLPHMRVTDALLDHCHGVIVDLSLDILNRRNPGNRQQG